MSEISGIKTTNICDEFAGSVQVCEPIFASFGGEASFHGPISTVRVHEDNVLVREALEDLPPGRVLVVDGGGSKRCALVGDKLAGIAASRGLTGIIVNGCVRDTREMSEIDVGVLALAGHPLRSRKEGKGSRDVTVQFGGVTWTPDHYVYADEDGIVVAVERLHKG